MDQTLAIVGFVTLILIASAIFVTLIIGTVSLSIKFMDYLEESSKKNKNDKKKKKPTDGFLLDLKVWLNLKLTKTRYIKITDTRIQNNMGEDLSFVTKLKFHGIYPYAKVNYSISPRHRDDCDDVLYYVSNNGVVETFNSNNSFNRENLDYLIIKDKRMVCFDVRWEPYFPFQRKVQNKKIYPKFEAET